VKLVLHIDRLVLRGVSAPERDALVASLRSALMVELARPGVAARLAAQNDRAALQVHIAPQTQARALGRAAAVGIVQGVTR
jgi:hypothetical protein